MGYKVCVCGELDIQHVDGTLACRRCTCEKFKRQVRHKYSATRTVVDGYKFGSKKEARHYQDLLLAKKSGELLFFFMQTPIHISPGVVYRLDFLEFWRSGEVRFTDVKGMRLPMYRLKKKLVEDKYPFKITEI